MNLVSYLSSRGLGETLMPVSEAASNLKFNPCQNLLDGYKIQSKLRMREIKQT